MSEVLFIIFVAKYLFAKNSLEKLLTYPYFVSSIAFECFARGKDVEGILVALIGVTLLFSVSFKKTSSLILGEEKR